MLPSRIIERERIVFSTPDESAMYSTVREIVLFGLRIALFFVPAELKTLPWQARRTCRSNCDGLLCQGDKLARGGKTVIHPPCMY